MRPTLPLELIYLCIEASSDSFAALGQLSLVSKECASEARKYIFKHIVLDRRERAVDLGSQYIRTFLELLTANKTLATYIHILFIKIEPSTYAATEVYAQTLPAILDLLTDLTIFQMDGLCPDYSDWNALPERLRSSITRRCSAPSITMLHFSNLKNLPHAPLRSAPGLLKISLVRVRSPQGAAENGSTGPGGSAAANLECFSVVDAGWVAGSYILADPGALSSLRRMSWYISDQRDLDLLKRVLQKCGGSLEELHIGFHHDHSNDGLHIGELVSLPQLRLLTFNSDTCLDLDADAGASSSLGSHLRLFLGHSANAAPT
ncbi:hypothetical protein DFP72DRAFT_402896 [Ephemerocybe angulata]|uniref:Uncharacterized protein n=1 Tax=Ephemerocybe angulata TaxID=980116 RepID=A0A8H6HWE1_9AGAR|nr:hypothetical protein DFP72DRAFT_402896 [Tulosesus angulatus]